MEANDAPDVAAKLGAAAPAAIATLSPELPANSSTKGIVTIIWPYSSVKGTFAFILAEPDFRLRLNRGQVRVNFSGPAAAAVAHCGLESQDEVVLALDGAEWKQGNANRRQSVSGADIDWQLTFSDKLSAQVKLAATGEVKLISAKDGSQQEAPKPIPEIAAIPDIVSTPADVAEPTVPIAAAPPHKTPAKPARFTLLGENEFDSPAFVKRARASYGSLFEDGYDIFEDDGGAKDRSRKRARFGRDSTAWRYTSGSPSPEPEPVASPAREAKSPPQTEDEEPRLENDNASQPVILVGSTAQPQQVDGDLQTMAPEPSQVAIDTSRGMEATALPTASPDRRSRSPHAISGQDGLFSGHGETDRDAEARGRTPDLPSMHPGHQPPPAITGSSSDHLDTSNVIESHVQDPGWAPTHTMYPPVPEAHTAIFESTTHIIQMDMQHDLHNPLQGLPQLAGAILDHENAFHDMEPMQVDHPLHESHIDVDSFASSGELYSEQASDYPPLEPEQGFQTEHHMFPNAQIPQANFTSQLDGVGGPSHINPFLSSEEPSASQNRPSPFAGAVSWNAANRPQRTFEEPPRSRDGTSEGSTSDRPVVLDDDSEDEGPSERSDAAESPRAAVEDPAEEEDAEVDDEVDGEYSEDAEEAIDDQDVESGDYDTRVDPDDDEDDSHDEDLQIHELEPAFDGQNSDEDSDAEEEEYDEKMQEMVQNGEEEEEEEEEVEDEEGFASQIEDEGGYEEEEEEEEEDEEDEEADEDEDEDEEEGDEEDEEELEDEYDEEEEEDMDDAGPSSLPMPAQRINVPRPAAQPVVIDLLSSSEDEAEGEVTDRRNTESVGEKQERDGVSGSESEHQSEDRDDEEAEDEEDVEDEDEDEEEDEHEDEDEEEQEDVEQEEDLKNESSTTTRLHRSLEKRDTHLQPSDINENEEDQENHVPSDVSDEAMAEDDESDQDASMDVERAPATAVHITQEDKDKDSAAEEVDEDGVVIKDGHDDIGSDEEMPDVDEKADHSAVKLESETGRQVDQQQQPSASEGVRETEVEQQQQGTPIGADGDDQLAAEEQRADDTPRDARQLIPLQQAEASSKTRESPLAPSSSPPRTQAFEPQDITTPLQDVADGASDAPDATERRTDEMEVDVTAQQLPTPHDTQVVQKEVFEAEVNIIPAVGASQGSLSPVAAAPVEQHVVSTTTGAKDAPTLPKPPVNANAVDSVEINSQTNAPEVDVASVSPIDKSSDQVTFETQVSEVSIAASEEVEEEEENSIAAVSEQIETKSSGLLRQRTQPREATMELDDELQASLLEEYSQELEYTKRQSILPEPESQPQEARSEQSPADQSFSRPRRHKNVEARTSTPPRLPQMTDESPDVDVGARLVRAADGTPDEAIPTEVSPRARRLLARTRAAQRTPSPKPRTSKLQSSPVDSPDSRPQSQKQPRIPLDSSPDVEDRSVHLARASFPNQPSAASSVKDDSIKLEDDSESMATVKLHLARHLRDELRDCYLLEGLRYHLNKTVDVMAVAMMQPPEPQRTKAREYAMSFTITDHSIGPAAVMEVQLYRPHKESLPVVKPGDVVLLRRFTVVSLTNKGFGLRTQKDGSSWAVFDREGGADDEAGLAQIKGPPVEYDARETVYVEYLREWHGLLDDRARAKLERANKRIVEAGGGGGKKNKK